ncbi:glycosyltransferase family 4 protein [Enterococcus rivorum]|uniref:Glycosyl transferase family 1 n=1 Tax=Enterococcus rivorum TaxID=762845 RepID=A0A1E5KVF5_9ENTE|nr:glycosyltransferase family 4 protein [Enterococcus rivorum]MBP2098409.1 glycosyltransferase involved in cell wall biosynthesis [Enterococcus rivorum]OEH81808.1 glycosyl transferase family 1 [Enterococcus rivorum]
MQTILFVSPTGTLDNGAEVSVFNLMKFLVNEGYKIINVAPTQQKNVENEYSKKFTEYGIDCVLINTQRWWWEDAPGHLFGNEIERAASYREAINKITCLIEENNVDLVISNTVNIFQGALAAALMKRPHFWLIHEFPENEFSYYIDKLDFIDDYSTEIFAVNGQLSDKIIELFPNRKIKSFAPYTEIETQKLSIGKQQRIVSIGRISERKNQLELIQTFEKLNRSDVELVFIGGWDEAYKKKCVDYIKMKHLKKIRFLGNKENPWDELTNKDICVFPSAMETFGLVYVEALLNGIPVILSDNPGHSSAYEMFKFGQMYQVGNIDQLTILIENKLDNFGQAKKESSDFILEAKNIYKLSVVYSEIIESIATQSNYQKNSVQHIKNLLTLNENKSKLSRLELKVRRKIQRIIYRLLKK